MFQADPVKFSSASQSLSSALEVVNELETTVTDLETYPPDFDYKTDVSEILEDLDGEFSELFSFSRKLSECKERLCNLDNAWALAYYQAQTMALSDFMGPLTEEDEYALELSTKQFYDYYLKYCEENLDSLTPEQKEVYEQLKQQKEAEDAYEKNKSDLAAKKKELEKERNVSYHSMNGNKIEKLEKEIVELTGKVAAYEFSMEYANADSATLKAKRDELEKKGKYGFFEKIFMSAEDKTAQKELTAQVNVLNSMIIQAERKEFVASCDLKRQDPEFEAKVAAGKEASKHRDANGMASMQAYDEEHILAGFSDSIIYEEYMSEEDIEMYYYILGDNNTYDDLGLWNGYEAGLDYLKHFEQDVNDAWGADLGEAQKKAYNDGNLFTKAAMTLGISGQQGLRSFFGGLNASTEKLMGMEVDTTISGIDIAAGDFRENLGDFSGFVYDVNQTTVNMVPAMTVGQLSPVLSATTIYAQSYGNNYKEMKRLGYTDNQAHSYSRDAAAAEAVLEGLTSSVPGIKFFPGKSAKTYTGLIVDGAVDLLKDAGGEVLQDTATKYIGNEYLLQENDLNLFTEENANTFIVSLGSSLIMGGGSNISNAVDINNSRAQVESFVYSATGSEVAYQDLVSSVSENTSILTEALSIVPDTQVQSVLETLGSDAVNSYVEHASDSEIKSFVETVGGTNNANYALNQMSDSNAAKVLENMDNNSFQAIYEQMDNTQKRTVEENLGSEVVASKMIDANEFGGFKNYKSAFKNLINNLGFDKASKQNFNNYSQDVYGINSHLNNVQNQGLTTNQQQMVDSINNIISTGQNAILTLNNTQELSTAMLSQISDLSAVSFRIDGAFKDANGNIKSKYNFQKYTDRVTYTGNEMLGIVARIEQLQGMIDMNLPEKQRAYQIYDLLAKEYDYAFYSMQDRSIYSHQTVASLRGLTSNNYFGREGLVCAGYAQVFKELCDRCGITCEYVRGDGITSDGRSERHAWNVIVVNGEVIPIDVTWHSGNGKEWFGASDAFAQTHKADSDEVYRDYSPKVNAISSDIAVNIEKALAYHDLKYGEGSGLLALQSVVETGRYTYITSMNGARELISNYSLEQINAYLNGNIAEENVNVKDDVINFDNQQVESNIMIDLTSAQEINEALVSHDSKYGVGSGRMALLQLIQTGDYNRITSLNGARQIIQKYSIEQLGAYLNGNIDNVSVENSSSNQVENISSIEIGNYTFTELTREDLAFIETELAKEGITIDMLKTGNLNVNQMYSLYAMIDYRLRNNTNYLNARYEIREIYEKTIGSIDALTTDAEKINLYKNYLIEVGKMIQKDKDLIDQISNIVENKVFSNSSINEVDFSLTREERSNIVDLLQATNNLKDLSLLNEMQYSDKLLLAKYLKTGAAATLLTLSQSEFKALYAYMSSNFKEINKYLDTGIDVEIDAFLGRRGSEIVTDLDNVMNRNIIISTQILQRGATTNDFEGISLTELPGKIMTHNRYRSSCHDDLSVLGTANGGLGLYSKDGEQKVKIDYICPPGTKAVNLGMITSNDVEKEVLLGRNQRIRYEAITMDGDTACVLAVVLPEGLDSNVKISELVDADTYELINSRYNLDKKSQNVVADNEMEILEIPKLKTDNSVQLESTKEMLSSMDSTQFNEYIENLEFSKYKELYSLVSSSDIAQKLNELSDANLQKVVYMLIAQPNSLDMLSVNQDFVNVLVNANSDTLALVFGTHKNYDLKLQLLLKCNNFVLNNALNRDSNQLNDLFNYLSEENIELTQEEVNKTLPVLFFADMFNDVSFKYYDTIISQNNYELELYKMHKVKYYEFKLNNIIEKVKSGTLGVDAINSLVSSFSEEQVSELELSKSDIYSLLGYLNDENLNKVLLNDKISEIVISDTFNGMLQKYGAYNVIGMFKTYAQTGDISYISRAYRYLISKIDKSNILSFINKRNIKDIFGSDDFIETSVYKGMNEYTTEIDVFNVSDNNIVYNIKRDFSEVNYSIYDVKNIIDNMRRQCPTLANGIRQIFISDISNPDDPYWAQVHNNPNFCSNATGGNGQINIYKYATSYGLYRTLHHEAAHILDNGTSNTEAWNAAIINDGNWSSDYAEDAYNSREIDKYGEDFADAVANLFEMGPIAFEQRYPNRAKILKEIIPEMFS